MQNLTPIFLHQVEMYQEFYRSQHSVRPWHKLCPAGAPALSLPVQRNGVQSTMSPMTTVWVKRTAAEPEIVVI